MTDFQNEPLNAPEPQFVAVGESLRSAREAQGMSVPEVASSLKLNPRQIEALESGRFDLLPGLAFTRGFLRNYARLLRLDPAPLLQGLESPEHAVVVELAPASNAHGDMPRSGGARFRRSVLPGVLAALGLLAVVVVGWYYDNQRRKPVDDLVAGLPSAANAPQDSAPAPASAPLSAQAPAPVAPAESLAPAAPSSATANAPAAAAPAPVGAGVSVVPTPVVLDSSSTPAKAAPPSLTEAPATPAAAGTERLVFEFEKDAWVEVKDKDGKILFSQMGKAGSTRELDGKPPFNLVVGNASFVKLQRNGKPVDLVGATKLTVARLRLE